MTKKAWHRLQPGDLLTFNTLCAEMAWLVSFGGWENHIHVGEVIVVTHPTHPPSGKNSVTAYVVHHNGAIGTGELDAWPGLIDSLTKIET